MDVANLLADIKVPDALSTLASFSQARERPAAKEDIFAEQKRKAWNKTVEARCDFSRRIRLTRRSSIFFISLWQKTVFGRTLKEIKADDTMVDFFAESLAPLIQDIIGTDLDKGQWCIITTPPRRHTERNFATRTALALSTLLHIPFHERGCACRSKQRVNAIFDVLFVPPEPNIICFDDIVTTGQTLASMKRALTPYHKNLLLITGINNII